MIFDSKNPTYQLAGWPEGEAGTRATLKLLSEIIRRYKTHPVIRELALSLVKKIPAKSYMQEIAAIHAFVRDRIRYVRDVKDVETIQTPDQTLRLGQGDCDDKVTLAGAMLNALGHPVRLVAIGALPGRYTHVYLEADHHGMWIPLETTEPWPLGRAAPYPYRVIWDV